MGSGCYTGSVADGDLGKGKDLFDWTHKSMAHPCSSRQTACGSGLVNDLGSYLGFLLVCGLEYDWELGWTHLAGPFAQPGSLHPLNAVHLLQMLSQMMAACCFLPCCSLLPACQFVHCGVTGVNGHSEKRNQRSLTNQAHLPGCKYESNR